MPLFPIERSSITNSLSSIRFFFAAPLACILVSMLVWRNGGAHEFCLGIAAGLLLVGTVASFSIATIEWKHSQQSNVEDTRFTN